MTQPRFADPSAAYPFVRDPQTLAVYALLAVLTSGYGIIGPLMPFLRADLGLSFTEGSYHTVALAIGTNIVGLFGQRIVLALGRRGAVALNLILLVLAQILLAQATSLWMSLAASLLFGGTVALSVCVVPAVMAERHGAQLGLAIAEANVLAYVGILIVPGIVSVAATVAGWRWSYLVPVLAYGIYWLFVRGIDFGAARPPVRGGQGGTLGFSFWCYWLFLMLGISAEFGLVVWSVSYLEAVAAMPRGLALWSSMIFPAGMIVGRIAGAVAMRRQPAGRLVLPTVVLALAGVLTFIASSTPAISILGLFLSGVGIANFYPVGITLAMFAAPNAPDAAAARAALASGTAILIAPLVLGAIADSAGIGAAFWAIPVLIVLSCLAALAARLKRG